MDHLLIGENFAMRGEGDTFVRHAVNAPEIAPVCNRKA
jgi:hypothetical protein